MPNVRGLTYIYDMSHSEQKEWHANPAQVDSGWTDEQKTEAGSLRTELAAIPGGTEAFSKLWRQMKNDAPSSVIDALANKLRELRDVEDQNQNANDEER